MIVAGRLALIAMVFIASPIYAQDFVRVEERKTDITISGSYQISIPSSLSSDASPGLVIALHGYQGSKKDFHSMDQRLAVRGFITVYPRGLVELRNDKEESSYCWADGSNTMSIMLPLVENFVTHVISEVRGEYSIDPEKIYLAGFSQGSAVAMYIAIRHPELIQRTACLSGGLTADNNVLSALNEVRNRFFFFGWGNQDYVGVRKPAEFLRDTMQKNGWSNFVFREYEGKHELVDEELTDVCRFFFAKKRVSTPKQD